MRKLFAFLTLLLIGVIVSSQFFLVPLAERTLGKKITELTKAEDVDVRLTSNPALLMLLGRLDHIDVKAKKTVFGDVRISELKLLGEKVVIPIFKDGEAFEIESADKLEIVATATNEDLRLLIAEKIENIDNIVVEIKPDFIKASGELNFIGRIAEISIEGNVVAEGSGVYFRMSKFNIKNSFLGQLAGNVFNDILLFDFKDLKLPVELDNIVQKNGLAEIYASRH